VTPARYAAGEEIFHQGDHGDRFYVIAEGEADVIGDGRLIRTIGPRDCFGEIALLRDTPRTTTVRARTSLHLHTLDRHHFLSALSDYQSSAREAETLALGRLATLNRPADRPATNTEGWRALRAIHSGWLGRRGSLGRPDEGGERCSTSTPSTSPRPMRCTPRPRTFATCRVSFRA
jgi:hypothetical protein